MHIHAYLYTVDLPTEQVEDVVVDLQCVFVFACCFFCERMVKIAQSF